MLEDSNMLTNLWAEAINTAFHTQNISIINQAQGKTPYRLMKNKKPTQNFLHVSGCKYFVLRNQGENLCNFETKVDEAIFVGYAIAEKSYRVYNLRLNIIMELVNAVFDDKKSQGLMDEGHHELLHLENEIVGDPNESDDDD